MIKTAIYPMQWLFMLLALGSQVSAAQPPVQSPIDVLVELDGWPHIEQLELTREQLVDHEIGLGAMQKVRGTWRFKNSERRSGLLTSYTWQVIDGFSAAEVLATLETKVSAIEQASLVFDCDGRSCGHPTQWANRVFRQRLLYGTADLQRYRVYAYAGEQSGRLILYSASRSPDRQYLQAQWLEMAPEAAQEETSEAMP